MQLKGLILLLGTAPTLAWGQSVDLFDLSLEELLKIEVVSMASESVAVAPAVSAVYETDFLQKLGLNDIYDFLDFALGAKPNYNLVGITNIQLRGLSDSNNQKILFLLDGVPYWNPATGDIPLNGIPISSIERVEVIRGPASVLYGTNSSSGVINIITKKALDAEVDIKANSEGNQKISAYWGTELDSGKIRISAELRNDNGFTANLFNSNAPIDFSCFCFPIVDVDQMNAYREHASLLAQYDSDDLSLVVQHYEETIGALENASTNSPQTLDKTGTLLAANYKFRFGETAFELFTDYNNFYVQRDITNILGFLNIPGDGSVKWDKGSDNFRWRTGLRANHSLSTSWSVSYGVETEKRQVSTNRYADDMGGERLQTISEPPFNLPFQFEPDGSIALIDGDSLHERAAYTQLSYKSDRLDALLGARYVNNSMSGNHVAPKASLIYKHNESSTFKLIYNEGFNSPTFRQLSARSSSGFKLDVDVEAELIRTWDVSYSYSGNNLYHSLSAYYIEAEDLIQFTQSSVGNSDEDIYRSGFEYETRYNLDNLMLTANVSYLSQGNKRHDTDIDALFNAKWKANLGVLYKFEQHNIGLSALYTGARGSVSSYTDINTHYEYKADNVSWYFQIQNLLDKEIITPNTRIYTDVLLQTQAGRSMTVGMNFAF